MPVWSPTSWLRYAYEQAADYADLTELAYTLAQLNKLPPLVQINEITELKRAIASAGRGEAFIVQAGDCAESFDDCQATIIDNKLKILFQLSAILFEKLHKPIVRIGRIAGQYAKPRSLPFETQNGLTLPSYRGDLINGPEFNVQDRTPTPQRLLQGYHSAAITLNYIYAVLRGDFAHLPHPHAWDIDLTQHSAQAKYYQTSVHSLIHSQGFIARANQNTLQKDNFYTSHEALHLHYEQALTRCSQDGKWYDSSTHLPWIGMRTAKIDSAHLEFSRGIQNPIGIKIGPELTPEQLISMLEKINPSHEEGRVLLITRIGTGQIAACLPPLITAVKNKKIPVTWSCDPMHGNTELTSGGIKTRHFDTILAELQQAVLIHKEQNSYLGGIHLELTGENVTECIGGPNDLGVHDLTQAYHSLVDPRLNYEQSLALAFNISQKK